MRTPQRQPIPAIDPSPPDEPHIVVIGAGFAGLNFCRKFRGSARITLVDKHNHHLFQPLLYQVAMSELAAPDIAEPTRSLFARRRPVTVLMDEVERIDLDARVVHCCQQSIPFDYLVLAAGGRTSYFGNDDWAHHAPGLKTLEDAFRIRQRVLTSFERAENSTDTAEQEKLLTFVVVGGGPTGVELAGALADLAKRAFRRDFRRIDTSLARIILIDGGDRLLKQFPLELSDSAKKQLEQFGVEVRLKLRVQHIASDHVELNDGTSIHTPNIIWGGGVVAVPLTETLGIDLDRAGRVRVEPDLSIPGYPHAFALGDIAVIHDQDGNEVPGVAPAAMQMGKHAARLIKNELRDGRRSPPDRDAFAYHDKGIMATIGRSKAVAWSGKLKLTGFTAWLAWLFIHLLFLVGFRNKVMVLIQWFVAYVRFKPGARILFSPACDETAPTHEVVQPSAHDPSLGKEPDRDDTPMPDAAAEAEASAEEHDVLEDREPVRASGPQHV